MITRSFLLIAVLFLLSNSQLFAQNTYSISGKINYTGPQKGQLNVKTWPSDTLNKVLSLDGDGDFIETDITDLSGSEITIQYWFKGVSNQSAVRVQSGAGWIVAGWNGKHILHNDDGVNGVTIGENYNDGEWHQITLSWKKATTGGFASYVDGKLVASRDSSNIDIPTHDAPVYIGAFNGLGEYSSGSLDEVAIWNRALSAQDIEDGWNKKLTGDEDGLIALWNFDNEDDELLDLSTSGFQSEFGGDANIDYGDIPKIGGKLVEANFENTESYLLENISEGEDYKVFSFIDVNGNGIADLNEPYGYYDENLDINKNNSDINILLKESPVIINEPLSVKATIGEEVVLKVEAAGTAPISYTWKFNNEDIEGTDRINGVSSNTLVIKNFQKTDEGIYNVVLNNEIGSAETTGSEISEFVEGYMLSGQVKYGGTIDQNKVLNLDGDGDYVLTPITNLSGDELTIQYWFRGTSLQSAVRQQSSGWIVAGWNGKHIIANDDGVNGLNIGEESLDGNWHHVTLSWKRNSESGFASYLDGELVDSRDSSDVPIPDYDSNVFFGAFNGVGEFSNGQLDEIAIWNKALSPEEVKNSFKHSYSGQESGLIGLWNFDDGTASDITGNGFDGTLNGDAKIVDATGGRIQPGQFQLLNVISGEDYVLTTFIDLDGDGKQDANEPYAESKPFNVEGEMGNLDIELLDPVQVVSQPTSLNLEKGQQMKISIAVSGTGPFHYKWLKNDKELEIDERINGNDSNELTISSMQLSDAGVYNVIVSNSISQVISSSALITIVPDNINDGLIGHWKLDENEEDSLVAIDSSQSFLDAELLEFLDGDPEWWVDGKIDDSLQFLSKNKNFVVVSEYEKPTHSLTISAWVWASSSEPWGSILKNWGDGKAGQFHFGLNASGQQLSNYISTSNGKSYSVIEDESFPLESWQHVVTTVDGLSVKLYRNGQLVGNTPYQGSLVENELQSIGIGAKLNDDGSWVSDNAGYWNGKMDDIGLWNRALTNTEILGIYQTGMDGNDLSNAKPVETVLPGVVSLNIVKTSSSKINLSWSDESSLFILQESSDAKNWTNSNASVDRDGIENNVSLIVDGDSRFYRLITE